MVTPMTRGEVVPKPARSPFAVALVQQRSIFHTSRHEIADHCGVSVRKVEEWEKGEAVPDVQTFKRLCGMFRKLANTPPKYTEGAGSTLADKALQDIQRDALRSKEPEKAPPPVEEFHVGLARIRQANELSQRELADLFGFVPGAIAHWENGRNPPSQENLELLYEALPDLKNAIEAGAVKAPVIQRQRSGHRSEAAKARPQLQLVKEEPAAIAEPVKPELKTEVKPEPIKPQLKHEAIPMRITGSDDPIVAASNRYAASRRALLLAQKKANEVRLLVAAADAALVNAQTEHDAALAAFDAAAIEPTGEP